MTENPYRPPTAESKALLNARNSDHSQKSRLADALEVLGWFFLYYVGMIVASSAILLLADSLRLLLS